MLNHYWIKRRFNLKKIFQKSKCNFVQYDPKLYKDNVQGLKKMKKTTFVDFSSILGQKMHFEKKTSKMHKNTVKINIFEKKMTEKLENWFCQK